MTLALRAGDWQAILLPGQGAAFAALSHRGRPLLVPLEGRDPTRTGAGAFWMLPWTNRLDGGRFPAHGQVFHLPVNRPDEGNALHGLSRDAPWAVDSATPDTAVLTQQMRAGPFDYAARLELRLAPGGLSMTMELRNTGTDPCPMGLGWHPWFARPPRCALRFAATHRLEKDARNLPTGAVPSPGIDAAVDSFLGFDGHFPGWDGTATLRRPDLTLTLRATGAWAHNIQVFAPDDHREALCLEPVSHLPDVINRPQLAEYGAMRVLAPGEAMQGSVELVVEAARSGE